MEIVILYLECIEACTWIGFFRCDFSDELAKNLFCFKDFLVLVQVVFKILRPDHLRREVRPAFNARRLNWIDVPQHKKKPPPKAGVLKARHRRVTLFPLCEGAFPHKKNNRRWIVTVTASGGPDC